MPTPEDTQALADRLRFAAESLTLEFEGLSRADAEQLIFAVAEEFLSDAQVALFVPTFATRRARQLLRNRPAEAGVVIPYGHPVEVENPAQPVESPVSAPLRSPADYAGEAKRLLERAKALRAAALVPSDRT